VLQVVGGGSWGLLRFGLLSGGQPVVALGAGILAGDVEAVDVEAVDVEPDGRSSGRSPGCGSRC
jgi:hypothetical protein